MVGIIGALEEEVILFKHDMTIKKIENIGNSEYVSGILNNCEVVIVRCGMGKVNAAICTTTLIEKYHVDFIINTGVGGCLKNDLNVLDIVVAEKVVQHDYDIVSLGYKLGQVDKFDEVWFNCDKRLNEAILKACEKYELPAKIGLFATGDRFIDQPDDKKNIVNKFNADVCDMESAAIAQVCTLNKTRFANIRTISDSTVGTDGAMQFAKFLKLASTHSVILIEDLLEHVNNVL